MKNTIKWKSVQRIAGIIAFIAVIGFSMAACSDNSDSTGGINGTWRDSAGMQVNISGSSGTIKVMGSLGSLWQSAYNRGYISVGTQYWRNIRGSGTNTWSGEALRVSYNTSSPNVATGTTYKSCTFSLSYDGQTLTVYGSDSDGSTSEYWYRY
jgi:multimeric flavodoxin WrbA